VVLVIYIFLENGKKLEKEKRKSQKVKSRSFFQYIFGVRIFSRKASR
jgi:hypothetical protein